MTLATILIRTKNEGATLSQVLRAVREQTERDFEVLVVDSGSADNTLRVARDYGARIVCIPPESFTYGYALNVGFEHSRGEVVVSLSGHAIPSNSHWLSSLLLEFSDPLVAGVSSHQFTGHPYLSSISRSFYQILYRYGASWNGTLRNFLFHCASSAIRTSVWRRIRFDEDMEACEDHDWARKVSKLGYRIAYCPTSSVIHDHDTTPWPVVLRKAEKETMAIWRIYLGLPSGHHHLKKDAEPEDSTSRV